ncbi:uncharacterized protein LOC113979598, partial [Neopelma chrysocephalum]|uniref:uncharacterized protein LOC113979598 n=1 Tax=Neopelma chrysocephalum TaxID=114329 RepID=UPI000FCD04B5
ILHDSLILPSAGIPTLGKNVVVAGRSKNVGMPIAMLLHTDGKHERPGGDATVTISHRYTPKEQLKQHMIRADIVVAAAGRAWLVAQLRGTEGAPGGNPWHGMFWSLSGSVGESGAPRAAGEGLLEPVHPVLRAQKPRSSMFGVPSRAVCGFAFEMENNTWQEGLGLPMTPDQILKSNVESEAIMSWKGPIKCSSWACTDTPTIPPCP